MLKSFVGTLGIFLFFVGQVFASPPKTEDFIFEVNPSTFYAVVLEGPVQDIFGISFKILSYPAEIKILKEGNFFAENDYIFFQHILQDIKLGVAIALVKKGPAKGENLAPGESKTIAIFSVSEKTAIVFVEVEAVNSQNEQIPLTILKVKPVAVASVKPSGKVPLSCSWGTIKSRS